jgi:hypothetical protein
MTDPNYLQRAIDDNHAEITGEGKTQRIRYSRGTFRTLV